MTLYHRQLGLALLASILLHGVLLSRIHFGVPVVEESSQSLFVDFGPMTMGSSSYGVTAEVSQEPPPVAPHRVLRPLHARKCHAAKAR
ncbi:MAG: hypothetical protein ACYDCF_06160, partial [Burkholderiales bacterium]